MSWTIRKQLELGSVYASNNLWSNAAEAFRSALEQLYASVGPGESLPPVHHLEKALQNLGDKPFDLSSRQRNPTRNALKQLRDEQAATYPGMNLKSVRFMSAFRAEHSKRWTLVYHDEREIGVPGYPISIPSGDPIAFLLDIGRNSLHSAHLSANRAIQLSYALSHQAWAHVWIAMKLYTVGKVLIHEGCSAVKEAARDYFRALLLAPDSSWALAHIGETYRNMANSWPPSVESITTPQWRVNDYVAALLYLAEAIRLAPEDFWAHAHFGATIVNVRAFTGVTSKCDLLDQLVQAWCPSMPSELLHEGLLDIALKSLNLAQKLQGNFYPWAQLYAADVLIIQSVVRNDPAKAQQPGTLGCVLTLDAVYLQPKLAGELFEPSELYDNPFFQFGLLYLWCNDCQLAWQYVCMGLTRTFKFQFVPGLETLLGYQLLANIADQQLRGTQSKENQDVQFANHVLDELPIPVPPTPFDSRDELIEFIGSVFRKVCLPIVDEFTRQRPDTNITVSLLQVCFVLLNFQQILVQTRGAGSAARKQAERISGEMKKCIDRILRHSGLRLTPRAKLVDYDRNRVELLFTHVYSDGLSHQMASALKYVKPKR